MAMSRSHSAKLARTARWQRCRTQSCSEWPDAANSVSGLRTRRPLSDMFSSALQQEEAEKVSASNKNNLILLPSHVCCGPALNLVGPLV